MVENSRVYATWMLLKLSEFPNAVIEGLFFDLIKSECEWII